MDEIELKRLKSENDVFNKQVPDLYDQIKKLRLENEILKKIDIPAYKALLYQIELYFEVELNDIMGVQYHPPETLLEMIYKLKKLNP